MVFSSLSFIYAFVPLVIVLYYLLKERNDRNTLLVFASLIFYAWGEPKYVLVMLGVSFVTYYSGIFMDRYKTKKNLIATFGIVVLLLDLFVFKYLNFVVGKEIVKTALPIGISFYTFQAISYIIDFKRGEIELQDSFFELLMYISFFPQLIAGPVVRYQTIENEVRYRVENIEDIEEGCKRFVVGLAKKILLANYLAKFADIVYLSEHGSYDSGMYWFAMLAYTLEIYFDFSAYSDMAIGLGEVFGFHFLENFDYPYASLSITDFWRRWHISLSSWFKDYVYIPLGGSRAGTARHILNILIVWALTGLWHGAGVNFILWGLYYAVFLILEKYVLSKVFGRLPKIIRWAYMFIVVNFGWILFNLTDFEELKYALSMMFNFEVYNLLDMVALNTDIIVSVIAIPLGLFFMLPIFKDKKLPRIVYIVLLGISIIALISSTYNPFIYFRF